MAKVLIVDDSILMRRNLKQIFIKAGYDIIGEATNGKEALDKYINLKPDLVTMDITMPIMGGLEAVKKIITEDSKANIIMISAVSQKAKVLEALTEGAKHYIVKPITYEKVIEVVDEVMELYDLENDNLGENKNSSIESQEPFEIRNENGVFKIKVLKEFNNDLIYKLDKAIQGLLIISPLKLEFNLDKVGEIKDEYKSKLELIIEKIDDAGGEIKFIPEDKF